MKPLSYIIMACLLISRMACQSQIKNQTTESVKIYGNCGMCESTIEKAGNVKNEASVDWDKDTKMATLTYDANKTSQKDILKRIALAGYDSDLFLAPDDTYANLPDCCQYERAKTTSKENDMSKDHAMHEGHDMAGQDKHPLGAVFSSYFEVKAALVGSDGNLASSNAKALVTAIDAVPMEALPNDVHMAWMKVLAPMKEDAQHIVDTKDIGHQRDHFITLSSTMYEVLKLTEQETPTYYQFCPMANDGKGAHWLSKDKNIMNPYYGSKMLTCGKTVETMETKN